MRAGFQCTDITPAIGMEQPGGYGKATIGAIHDSLKVRAAVFEADGSAAALVGVDTCALGAELTRLVRAEVQRRCGIPGDRVLLAASHTHSGGPLFGLLPDEYADADPFVKALIHDHSTAVDPVYHDWARGQIVTAVCEAWRKREDARLAFGRGAEGEVAYNRRFRMRSGRVYTHPGKGNPDIVEPAGPTDPEVGVLAAWGATGALLGCVANFACHGTTFAGGVSADWIHWLEQTVEGALRCEAPVVFLNGACGDVTQVDNRSLREPEFGERWARFVGTRVGAEAVRALVSAEPGDGRPVGAASEVLRIPRRKPSRARLEAAQRLVKEGLRTGRRDTAWTFAKDLLIAGYLVEKQPIVPVEIQAVQVGPALFVANPSEMFCALGLEVKRRSAFPFTWVVELANGAVGYVPTDDAFTPHGGGYETVLTSYSNLEITAGRRIVEASVDVSHRLRPGETPRPPTAASGQPWTGTPWEYGVLGPELE